VEECRTLSDPECALREKARGALADSVARAAAVWKQRGKFKAIREGDENTKFFHAMASHRHRRNFIRVLDVNGVPTVEHADKAAALYDFYSSMLGQAREARWDFDLARLYSNLPRAIRAPLVAPFELAEIKAALGGMDRSSAPGPDGLGPSFYRTAWDHVSPDLARLFDGFHAGEVELDSLNRAHVALLPKTEGIPGPGSFRPVSLQNCSMKMICKAHTTQLQNQIPLLVDADQSGFVAGRSISENFVLATEIVQCCRARKAPTIVLKLDFAKAFDSKTGAVCALS
jgi:hypothetical protein